MTASSAASKFSRSKPMIGYTLMIAGVIVIYLIIRAYGNALPVPAPVTQGGAGAPVTQVHVNDFLHVLLALVLVIATARTLGTLFRLVHQPPVVGEIIAGILLGPSLLGHIAPGVAAYVLPHSVAPFLNVISQVGVILYMFLVGLELDPSLLRNRAHSTVAISHASIIAPFLLGASVALLLYPRLSTNNASFTAFSLFLGVSMSVTAFPVLARILTDRRIHKTRMGAIALTCAAVDDVTAWCLLAFVVSVTQSHAGGAIATILMALAYIAVMAFVARPFVVRVAHAFDNRGGLTQGSMALILLAILLSSLSTELIGIHAIFGAFVLGTVIPHDSTMARELTEKLEDFIVVFLLPSFFAFTGLRTQIGLVSGVEQWMICGLIITVASVGKFGGSAVAARLSGLNWRDSSALGVLMNTRGLMELIVLNIGLDLGVISPALFAMLVIMALVTTFATTPILHFITRRHLEQERASSGQASASVIAASNRSGILVPVLHPNGVASLLDIALSANPPDAPPPRVLALVRSAESSIRSGLREANEIAPSRSAALAVALDFAWSRGTVITPQALLTTDPAEDILSAASEAQISWLFLESRRSIFGSYPKRTAVAKILRRAAPLSINVAVVIHRNPRTQHPLYCIVDFSNDGRSALELATRIAQSRQERLHVILATGRSEIEMESALEVMLREPQRVLSAGLRVSRAIEPTPERIGQIAPNGLIIMGKIVADRLNILCDGLTERCSVIVVQGGADEQFKAALPAGHLQTVPA